MKTKLITLGMLAACSPLFSVAQAAPGVSTEIQSRPATEPCLKVKKISTGTAAVPAGQWINVSLRLESASCKIAYQLGERHSSAVGLYLAPTSPFRLAEGSTTYRKLHRKDGSAGLSGTAQKIDYELVIKAPPDVPVGKQTMDATVRYQVLNSNGDFESREQSIAIPLEVVPAGTHMHESGAEKFKEAAKIAGFAVLILVLSPLLFVMAIVNGPNSC